ncbi:hypothetical protein ACFQPF_02585 [Fictibacillus iocasae]|uniref:Uncharacterized protein n=1 Tax=Fictibacillus iocasae TaxID=2715437 RepID=A0ABW2NMN3_9BACL
MFHPSVYDNLKVVLEGAVYDADFEEKIIITGREDLLDMASAARKYKVSFSLKNGSHDMTGYVSISSSLEDLYQEKINDLPEKAGCSFEYGLTLSVMDIDEDCLSIQHILAPVYGLDAHVQQDLLYQFGKPRGSYENRVRIAYNQPMCENDIPFLEESLPIFIKVMAEIQKR